MVSNRPPVAHHDHWIERLGPLVLVRECWYQSVGSTGDSYDNALAEAINGLAWMHPVLLLESPSAEFQTDDGTRG